MRTGLCWVSLRSVAVVVALAGLMTVGFWGLTQPASHVAQAGTNATVLGDPLPNLTSLETTMFNTGDIPFSKQWDPLSGLGPGFTQVGCQVCHAIPVNGGVGNSSTASTLFAKINSDGSFNPLTNEGGMLLQPQSNQRFIANCRIPGEVVPADATIVATHQAPAVFGAGLIDNIPDSQILANAVDKGMGVHGVPNMVTDEHGNFRVGHFGFKAQTADLLQITALAEQHDLGVTNPLSPIEDKPQGKSFPPACSIPTEPNDNGTQMIAMYHYVLYLAPNTPGAPNTNGQAQFINVGCALCHIPPGTSSSYTTTAGAIVPVNWPITKTMKSKALSSQPVALYSDLLLHDLGGPDGDGIVIGFATGTMYRTAPLWGLSLKLNNGVGLLHDGSAADVPSALLKHGGEASTVISNFNALSAQDQADLIAFISSL